jgi:hypothetical protein
MKVVIWVRKTPDQWIRAAREWRTTVRLSGIKKAGSPLSHFISTTIWLSLRTMKRLFSAVLFLPLMLVVSNCAPGTSNAGDPLPEVQVYKSPTCGCCTKWVSHMEENGFNVTTTDLRDVRPVKQRFGLPGQLASCHTALIDGYVVEGHVPADVVKKMLRESPDVAGIAVPGMPIGSPGMEVEGRQADAYDIVAFTKSGSTSTFASR